MYAEACAALGADPFGVNQLREPMAALACANVLWNLAMLITKDMGDVEGDVSDGLRTIPACLPDDGARARLCLGVFALMRVVDAAAHHLGYFAPALPLFGFVEVPVKPLALAIDAGALVVYAHAFLTLDLDGSKAKRKEFMGKFWPFQFGCFLCAFYAVGFF